MPQSFLTRTIDAIASARRRRAQIIYRAYHDELTGLPNRHLFHDRLDAALARGPASRFALAYVDVDEFKYVNDAFGHWAGDELLRHIGSRLTGIVRSGDTVARLGGDEFALLLLDVGNGPTLSDAVQRIRQALRWPVQVAGQGLLVSCSIGVSHYPADGNDASSLIRLADRAMYQHKRSARSPRPETTHTAPAARAILPRIHA